MFSYFENRKTIWIRVWKVKIKKLIVWKIKIAFFFFSYFKFWNMSLNLTFHFFKYISWFQFQFQLKLKKKESIEVDCDIKELLVDACTVLCMILFLLLLWTMTFGRIRWIVLENSKWLNCLKNVLPINKLVMN